MGFSYTLGNLEAHATLWSGGVATDLNTLLSSAEKAAGWVFDDWGVQIAINNNGWIAVSAHNLTNDDARAYSLTPTAAVPEPAGWALMPGGFAVVTAMRRRQCRRAD